MVAINESIGVKKKYPSSYYKKREKWTERKSPFQFDVRNLCVFIYLFKLIDRLHVFDFLDITLFFYFFLLSPTTNPFIFAVQNYLSGSLCSYNYFFSCKICQVSQKIREKITVFYFVFCSRYRWSLNLDLCVFLVEIELDYCGSVDLSDYLGFLID